MAKNLPDSSGPGLVEKLPDTIWKVFGNPIFIKNVRTRLRPKAMISWGIFTFTAAAFIFLGIYLTGSQRGIVEDDVAAKMTFLPIFGIQAFILMFMGTGSVAWGITMEKERGLIDLQRMTPMSPVSKIVGYLFGLPVREYYMFLVTLPFTILAVIMGGLPIINVLQLYLVFFTSVVLYHMTGLAAGMVARKPRRASWFSRVLVLVLYLFLPRLAALGFTFLGYLTVMPTLAAVTRGQIMGAGTSMDVFYGKVGLWQEVPFFGMELNTTIYTLLLQGFLIFALGFIVYRKWKERNNHAFSKVFAVIFFAVLQFLLIGSLWPFLTGEVDFNTPVIFRSSALSMLGSRMTIVLYAFFFISGTVSLMLIHIVTPTRHTYVKGLRRAFKLKLASMPRTHDAASNLWVTASLAGLTLVGFFILIMLTYNTERFSGISPPFFAIIELALLFAGLTFYSGLAREYLGFRGFLFFAFFLWVLPFLAFLIIAAALRATLAGSYLSVMSPVSSFLFAILNIFRDSGHVSSTHQVSAHAAALTHLGVFINVSLSILFAVLLRRKWKRLHDAG